ncbi:DUF3667 domain-containing protein [Muricauda sp. 2012CJ35-5]|uniref:DUF3667 domain-containing protein n=1 Tax=Flagellimonas spongiicola TaxID=2942208 RepID=A0ABT0PUW8_9FLAO|nr:DUF3667 domain-containing protein [Allomuricauda spongiicola]MCL6275154.1 DUF3667 domain-containing protein [Allomuricauda spongiicola]
MGNKPTIVSKGRYELKFRGTECLNCGHILDISDKYCPNCGQANSIKKLVLKDFWDEFFSSLINYDSKLLKTLAALLLRPGSITKDYIQGKRVTYTNPFRFLLSLAFLYFLLFAYNNSFSELDKAAENLNGNINSSVPVSFDLSSGQLTADSTLIKEQVTKSLQEMDSMGLSDAPATQQIQYLDSLGVFSGRYLENEANKDSIMLADPKKYYEGIRGNSGFGGYAEKMEFFSNMIRFDSLTSFEEAKTKYEIGGGLSTRMAYNSTSSLLRVIKEPGTFLNATLSKLPFVIFFFLPLFTVFIWMVYIRKKYTYTDHLIFSFHNQSLLFILLILSLIIDLLFSTSTMWIFLLIFSVYLYKSMRNFYGQGRIKTILKYFFLNSIFAFLAFFVLLGLLTGSVFTY